MRVGDGFTIAYSSCRVCRISGDSVFTDRIGDRLTIGLLGQIAVADSIGVIAIVCYSRDRIRYFGAVCIQMHLRCELFFGRTDPILVAVVCPALGDADLRRCWRMRVGDGFARESNVWQCDFGCPAHRI